MKYGHKVIITHLITTVCRDHMEFFKECGYIFLPEFIRETQNKEECDHQACSVLLVSPWVIRQILQPENSQ